MLLHETNTIYGIILNFLLTLVNVQRCPPGWGNFEQNADVNKMEFVLKMSRRGEFSYYLTIKGSIVMYVDLFCNRLSLL